MGGEERVIDRSVVSHTVGSKKKERDVCIGAVELGDRKPSVAFVATECLE